MEGKLGNKIAIRYLLFDSFNNLWISTWKDGLVRYNLEQQTLHIYSLKAIKRKEDNSNEGEFDPVGGNHVRRPAKKSLVRHQLCRTATLRPGRKMILSLSHPMRKYRMA
jgi:hypothetical protein